MKNLTAFKAFAQDFRQYLEQQDLTTNHLSNKELVEAGISHTLNWKQYIINI